MPGSEYTILAESKTNLTDTDHQDQKQESDTTTDGLISHVCAVSKLHLTYVESGRSNDAAAHDTNY